VNIYSELLSNFVTTLRKCCQQSTDNGHYCLLHWQSTFVYSAMGEMQHVARVCTRQLTLLLLYSCIYLLPCVADTDCSSGSN